MVVKLSEEGVFEEGTLAKMTPEVFCFITSALCAMLLVGIEAYHILNTKHYNGSVIPLIEGFLTKIIPEDTIESEMDPTEMV